MLHLERTLHLILSLKSISDSMVACQKQKVKLHKYKMLTIARKNTS